MTLGALWLNNDQWNRQSIKSIIWMKLNVNYQQSQSHSISPLARDERMMIAHKRCSFSLSKSGRKKGRVLSRCKFFFCFSFGSVTHLTRVTLVYERIKCIWSNVETNSNALLSSLSWLDEIKTITIRCKELTGRTEKKGQQQYTAFTSGETCTRHKKKERNKKQSPTTTFFVCNKAHTCLTS